jgi:hypothetical protein
MKSVPILLATRARTIKGDAFWRAEKSLVQCRAEDGDYEMGEVGRAFVELKVTHNTVVGEIFRDAGFRDTKMFRKARLDGLGAAATGCAAQKTSNRDGQGLARFDMIVGGKIGIAEQENAGTDGRAIGFVELEGSAGQQATELHLQ